MEEYVYNALAHYFTALRKTGHYGQSDVRKLVVLLFWHWLIDHDYRGYVREEDYKAIDRALYCLYGTSCLLPYPDYLKMGKLKLGDFTELLARTRASERSAELLQQQIYDNDALIEDTIDRVDNIRARSGDENDVVVAKPKNYVTEIPDIDVSGADDIPER